MATALMLQSQLLAQMLFPTAPAGPPCRHFAIGKCTRVPCKFSHGVSNSFPPSMMAGFQQVQQMQAQAQAQAQAQSQSQAQTGPPCRDFALGHCSRGNSCRFLHHHSGRASTVTSRSRPPKPCSDFARGSCTRDGCKFLHVTKSTSDTVCRDFAAGDCERGSSCRFSHDPEALEPAPLEPCRDFSSGKCVREHCRFAHEDSKTEGGYHKEDRRRSSDKYDSDEGDSGKRGRGQERSEDNGRKKLRITTEIDPRRERERSEGRSEHDEPSQREDREWSDGSNHGS